MAQHVYVNLSELLDARKGADAVLTDLGPVVRAAADKVLARAQTLVPRDTGALAASGFTDGPQRSTQRLSVMATAGYEHHAAGPIHEGVHHGQKMKDAPPRWLRKAARPGRATVKRLVAETLRSTLSRLALSRR